MATRKSQKVEPPRVIGAISEFAGTLVGTAVVMGKHIVKTSAQAGEEPLSKPRKKAVPAPAKKKKKATVQTKAKNQKVKKKAVKKKVAKKKRTGPVVKSANPRKGSAQSPAKKKKRKAKIS